MKISLIKISQYLKAGSYLLKNSLRITSVVFVECFAVFGVGSHININSQTCWRISVSSEAVARRCSIKIVFLEILQTSQENTCARLSFLIKLQAGLRPAALLKKRPWHWCFPVNFAKLNTFSYRTPPVAASVSCQK